MKITYRTETEVLQEVEQVELEKDESIIEGLKKKFDRKPIKKYEIIFEEGIKVGQCHNFSNIDHEQIKEIIVTIA